MPGTLPAAGSSAPGAAIPARAPPMLRAASSRAAEEARPGAGTARARLGSAQARLGTARARRPFPVGSGGTNPGNQGVRLLGLGSTRTSRPRFPVRGTGGSAPIPPRRGLPPGFRSVLFRCRRSRRVGRAIYSERLPRAAPAAPARSPERRQERAQLGSFTAETRRRPRTPQPQAGGAGGGRWVQQVPAPRRGSQDSAGGRASPSFPGSGLGTPCSKGAAASQSHAPHKLLEEATDGP